MVSAELSRFIADLPKAELHVHHVGSASPRIVAELAARHPGSVPHDPVELAEFFRFRDFAHFIDVYLAVSALLTQPEDVRLLTYEVARDMAAQQIRYAELTLTPYTSVRAGIAIEAYVEAVEDARVAAAGEFGIELAWIFDIPGESGIPAAEATIDYAVQHGPDSLVGFGLGGPEIGVPRPQFARMFEKARAAGLHSVPHAGETTGAQTIVDALDDLGAERIGHGIAAAADPEVLKRLVDEQIPLEVCPTSNVATRAVSSLGEHPLPVLFAAGVALSINSDDPPMFATTLTREYEIAAELLNLDHSGVAGLARSAVRQSFASASTKQALLLEIDHFVARFETAKE